MKRKLIEQHQEKFVVCDNEDCGYDIPFTEELNLLDFIDKPCPQCGENLLTKEDYITSIKMQKAIDFINKWFSWILIFAGKIKEEDYSKVMVHVHKGINISKDE
jgi:hypothetical protein